MNTAESIAETLRTRILSLEYAVDAPLREVALAQAFGASRKSVREALALLAAEGIVRHEANRGARVSAPGPADIDDLYRVRRVLEVEGAAACAHASSETIARVQLAFRDLDASAHREQDSLAHALADMNFHASVIAVAQSPRLGEIFDRISVEMTYAIRLLQHGELGMDLDAADAVRQHEPIARAIAARDPQAAVAAVEAHISANIDRLQQVMARRHTAPGDAMLGDDGRHADGHTLTG